MTRTPMDSLIQISPQQSHFPLQLSSHPIHTNTGSDTFAMDKDSELLDKKQEGQMAIVTVGR